ncbi:putative kinase domain protein [Rhizoctonia solani 123E]|uniref:Putative kinase domain protein n=2 Tax=Rhizoctonia solani AG-3 TaxID=1086053 RepID=A0A074RKP5_9AGAM|nr:putative kinase domain protein [Rhizoctonia solani 123E]
MTGNQGETPTGSKRTGDAEYCAFHVADARQVLASDLPVIPEVTLSSLMHAVLPPLPAETLKSTCRKLRTEHHIQSPDTNDPRWACLPQDPCASKRSEDQTFKFLEKIAEVIQPQVPGKFTLSVVGNITPVSHRHDTSRPDGFIHLNRDSLVRIPWADIMMTMEFKKIYDIKNNMDDIAKVIWSMHHIMRTDARRTHVYGLTCENTTARLWYCDRSDFVASAEFDVNKDWEHLVRIILSILMASPIQLGLDPTMKAIFTSRDSEPSYIITVHNIITKAATQYQTSRVLSDVGADSPVSRGTRVWMVQRLVNGIAAGPFYALKDVWVHDDRTPEHEIILEVRKAQPDYAQHLLTPVDYGYVPHDLATPLVPDNTHKTLRRQELELTGVVLQTQSLPAIRPTSKTQTSKSAPRDSIGSSEDIPKSAWGVAEFGKTYLSSDSRQHYRMVVEEIGEPVHSLRNFTDYSRQSKAGGRVHRDVSGGNILLVPALKALPKRGVIMDLEYAKDIDDMSAPRDMRTGTAAFMATEVAYMKHHRLDDLRSILGMNSPSPEDPDPKQADDTPLPPFRHNPLHDMESMWWLCIWMMFRLVPSNVSGEQYFHNYRIVFFNFFVKERFVCHPTEFLEYTTHISIKAFIEVMNKWRKQLNSLYFKCYKAQDALPGPLERIKIDDKTLQSAYDFGIENLKSLKTASMAPTTDFVPMTEKYHQFLQNASPTVPPTVPPVPSSSEPSKTEHKPNTK